MAKIVEPSDFSDEQLSAFVGQIERLTYVAEPDVPAWLRQEAEAFAAENRRPTVDELHHFITAAVRASMGWDEPDEPKHILHAALKAYYLLAWNERLHRSGHDFGTRLALQVVFTPMFRHAEPT